MARKAVRTLTPPEGLFYSADFLGQEEQDGLLSEMEALEFYDYVLQGVAAKRKVHHFGFTYEFYTSAVKPALPFPLWLETLKQKVAGSAHLSAATLEQALIAKYDNGAGIGWHRDAPAFGRTVIGISLAGQGIIRFRRERSDGDFDMFKQNLSPGSLYVLSGPARSIWQHSLSPVKELRYSITFRTVHKGYKSDSSALLSASG